MRTAIAALGNFRVARARIREQMAPIARYRTKRFLYTRPLVSRARTCRLSRGAYIIQRKAGIGFSPVCGSSLRFWHKVFVRPVVCNITEIRGERFGTVPSSCLMIERLGHSFTVASRLFCVNGIENVIYDDGYACIYESACIL